MENIKYWYIGGDIHGDWRPVRNWVVNELTTPRNESALILLGDVGANYYLNKRDREFKEQLNKLGIRIYCIRGNHEMRVDEARKYSNYKEFSDPAVRGTVYVEQGYPNIYYFRDDGGQYVINEKSILIIPGAYSVDKNYRLAMGWSWFPNEQLSIEERKNLFWQAALNKYEYIFAHTCPYSWEKYINDLFIGRVDQSTIDKTTEVFLESLLYAPGGVESYKHFYFGHFHDDRDIPEVKATMLYKKIIPLGEYIKET